MDNNNIDITDESTDESETMIVSTDLVSNKPTQIINNKLLNLEIKNKLAFMAKLNMSRSDILNSITHEFNISNKQAYRQYTMYMHQLEMDYSEKVRVVREKRIQSVRENIKEAYLNYLRCDQEKDKIQWYAIYLRESEHLDQYYPNSLTPTASELENETSTIIEFIQVGTKSDE